MIAGSPIPHGIQKAYNWVSLLQKCFFFFTCVINTLLTQDDVLPSQNEGTTWVCHKQLCSQERARPETHRTWEATRHMLQQFREKNQMLSFVISRKQARGKFQTRCPIPKIPTCCPNQGLAAFPLLFCTASEPLCFLLPLLS